MKQASRIKQLFRNAGLAILEVGKNGKVNYLNHAATNLLGVPEKEALGQHVWEFLKEGKKAFDRIVEMIQESPTGISDVQIRIIGSRIRSLWAELCVTPFVLAEGDEGYLIFLKDITKRKISDDRIRETTNILVNILNDSADAIMGITLENRIFLWNRGAEDIFGYTREEMTDSPLDILIPDDVQRQEELDYFTREAMEKGFIRNYETERLRKDGRRIVVNITRTLVQNAAGEPVGFSAIVRDITREKALQKQVIQNERLSVVGQMAAQVAHEIRNPLSSIMLNLELVEDELEELNEVKLRQVTAIRRLLRIVDTEVSHLNNITDDYLSFVRMPMLKTEELSSNSVVDEVVELLRQSINRKRIHLDRMKREVPLIKGDRNQLRRAVLNVLKNAVEASEEEGIIRIWCSVSKSRQCLYVNIRDFGPGIPEKEQERVFELFYTTKLTGSGLGMHITRMILKEHNGDVDIFSKPGKGTLVRLKLPLEAESC
ncbi:MAG: MEKHLA domain-containing protein [Acidobacteria bacterium]|nr:MEKHLA domain-containing protein [Acidobacteriota bacterium]